MCLVLGLQSGGPGGVICSLGSEDAGLIVCCRLGFVTQHWIVGVRYHVNWRSCLASTKIADSVCQALTPLAYTTSPGLLYTSLGANVFSLPGHVSLNVFCEIIVDVCEEGNRGLFCSCLV